LKISVALCSFNGEAFIAEQLNSILDQTLEPDEIIICDDASTDATLEIVEDFKVRFPDMIQLHTRNQNCGTIKNFERAISLTTGDIIFLSDQDDIWYPGKIEKMISVLNDRSNILLLFSNGNLIDDDGVRIGSSLWDKWNFQADMRKRWKNNRSAFSDLVNNNNKVTGATVAFKKELKEHVLPIRVPDGYWHDAWLSLHAAALNGLYFIEEPLIQYRVHSNQQIGLPESKRFPENTSGLDGCVSYDEYYKSLNERYPKLFREKKPVIFIFKKIIRLAMQFRKVVIDYKTNNLSDS